jgi:hypothetical protein
MYIRSSRLYSAPDTRRQKGTMALLCRGELSEDPTNLDNSSTLGGVRGVLRLHPGSTSWVEFWACDTVFFVRRFHERRVRSGDMRRARCQDVGQGLVHGNRCLNDGGGGICWRVGNVTPPKPRRPFLPPVLAIPRALNTTQRPSAIPTMYAASRPPSLDESRKEYASAHRHALSSL